LTARLAWRSQVREFVRIGGAGMAAGGSSGSGKSRRNALALPFHPLVNAAIERATGLRAVRRWYENWLATRPQGAGVAEFLDSGLARLGVTLNPRPVERFEAIPRSGPLIVVANHPLGGIDGMLLARALLRLRPDLKVLTNRLLLAFPEYAGLFVGVDILGSETRRANAAAMRELVLHLAAGGAVLMFPATAVSELSLGILHIADPEWTPMAGRLALKSRATCVPVNIRARNAWWFYLAGLVHERLRTALLVRAMLAHRGRVVPAAIGAPVTPDELAATGDGAAATLLLRRRCEDLAR